MKEITVHSLVIARTLLERAEPLCNSNDRYLASAGLILLQDSLEAVFYSIIVEIGSDENKNIEKKSFDELIAELIKAGINVPKSGTLKALNKQRVLTKHYAQVAEPITVRNYFDAACDAIDFVTNSALGMSIRDLFIADIIKSGESKDFLKTAERSIIDRNFLKSLISTRKAIYVEFEEDYSIYEWRDNEATNGRSFALNALKGGYKAPSWTKNKDWIEKNVKVPTDYIKIDFDNMRFEAMEMGIHTVDLQNLLRLTPSVFRSNSMAPWSVTYDASYPSNNATESNARYCLDRAVSIILKKQEHAGARRDLCSDLPFDPPSIYLDQVLYERPSKTSNQVHVVSEGFSYRTHRIVGGFDPAETYYELSAVSEEQTTDTAIIVPAHYFRGYLLILPEST